MDLYSIFLPNIAHASFDSLLANINREIVNPLINLLFAIAIAYFLYGVFVFMTNMDNENKRSEGKMHMLYGIVGLTVMMGVWGILGILLRTFNISSDEINPEAGEVHLRDIDISAPELTPSDTN